MGKQTRIVKRKLEKSNSGNPSKKPRVETTIVKNMVEKEIVPYEKSVEVKKK